MFRRTRTTARINAYMIYASSTSTLQPEQTDTLVFELYFCVESRKHQTGMVPCTVYNTWSQKSHSRLHVLGVGTQYTFVKQPNPNLNIDET